MTPALREHRRGGWARRSASAARRARSRSRATACWSWTRESGNVLRAATRSSRAARRILHVAGLPGRARGRGGRRVGRRRAQRHGDAAGRGIESGAACPPCPHRPPDQPGALGRPGVGARAGRLLRHRSARRGQRLAERVEAAGMREAVGAVAGLDVLHLQCHIGFDAISLARRGARVVGADFSPASLEKARGAGQALRGRTSSSSRPRRRALPVELHNRFDLVYATIGVLVLDRGPARVDALGGHGAARRRQAAAGRRPPALLRWSSRADPLRLDFPYVNDGPRTLRRARLLRGRGPRRRRDRGGQVRPLARRDRQRRARGRPEDRARSRSTWTPTSTRAASVLAREDDGRYRLRVERRAAAVPLHAHRRQALARTSRATPMSAYRATSAGPRTRADSVRVPSGGLAIARALDLGHRGALSANPCWVAKRAPPAHAKLVNGRSLHQPQLTLSTAT